MLMFLRRQRVHLRRTYEDYPRSFWILVLATFIDSLGGFLLFPFMSLYITQKFGVGMTEVGFLFGLFSISNTAGGLVGGALTDRIGRKSIVVFGLVTSALIALILGVIGTFELFAVAVLVVGIFASMGGPARQSMMADLLPEERRAEGFGILRVTFNVSATVAPAVAGILAARSYLLLFVTDAVISLVTAVIVVAMLPETRPALHMGVERESVLSTFRGYFTVLQDSLFLVFGAICMLMALVYMQINTTMGVYLRDVHGISTQGYGYLLSVNAIMVVLLQFSFTRRVKKIPPFLAMALGTALYAIGFGAFGFMTTYAMFLWAIVVITVGEMVVAPISQALVARMAPEDMRGRYNAVFGFAWVIPGIVGPLLAGLVMDNLDPRWVWYAAGLIGLVAALGFVGMHRRVPQAMPVRGEAAA